VSLRPVCEWDHEPRSTINTYAGGKLPYYPRASGRIWTSKIGGNPKLLSSHAKRFLQLARE